MARRPGLVLLACRDKEMKVETVLPRLILVILAGLLCTRARGALLATANVIAPLDLDGGEPGAWDAFNQQLRTAKSMGVNAVSVDVWWGKVEKAGDNVFDWRYYDRIVASVKAAGLHWV